MFVKRLVAVVAVSALSVIGIAPAASAAKSKDTTTVSVTKAPTKPGSNYQNRIDWD